MTAVYLEEGQKRVFACAVDWPGWCRAGRNRDEALEALAAAAPRYAVVARQARVKFPSTFEFDVVERVKGTATTEFGAPGVVPALDLKALKPAEAKRLAALVGASWKVFDRVVAGAPAKLRKGPRGGGRDRDKIVEHVLGAEVAYARKLGLRIAQPALGDAAAISANRTELLKALRTAAHGQRGQDDEGWPPRYAARRTAWHVMDHAWEIENRSEP